MRWAKQKFWLRTMALLAFAIPQAVSAAIITFSGLTGANGDPFLSPYTEAGYIVTATAGQWVQGEIFGNPAPSMFSGAGVTTFGIGRIDITKVGGGTFTFSSVDLASNGLTSYAITGAGFQETGTVGPVQNFSTIFSNDPLLALTSLTITMSPQVGAVSYNLDNIALSNAVPEPSPVMTLTGGLVLLYLLRRRFFHSRRCSSP